MQQPSEQLSSHNIATNSQQAPRGWLPASEAAAMMGISKRSVQLRCNKGELAATQAAGKWWIDPDCNAALRLASGDSRPSPAPAGSGLAGLTETRRARAFKRFEMVTGYLAGLDCKPSTMRLEAFRCQWIERWNLYHPQNRTSRAALMRWLAAYEQKGVEGLVDHRGGFNKPAPFSPEAKEFILGMYLRQERLTIPYIYKIAEAQAREDGLQLPSLRTVQTWIATRVDPKHLAAGRCPQKFRDRCTTYVKRDWTLVRSMEAWVADHRIVDVFIPRKKIVTKNGRQVEAIVWERPWVTVFMDCRSWLPVSWIVDFDSPNAHRVASAFVQAVEQHGSPEHVILDNGKDFRAHEVAGGRSRRSRQKLFDERRTTPLMETLGVTVHWAKPYNPAAKIIERWFRIMSEQFDKTWPTYIANTPANRPERMKGVKASNVDLEKLNLQKFREAFGGWIRDDYALQDCPSAACPGKSSARAFAELRAPDFAPVRPASETLSLLLSRGRRVAVGRNGLYVPAFGGFYWSDCPEMERRRGASGRDLDRHVVYRYIIGDPSKIFVFDAKRDDTFICIATPYIGNNVHPLEGGEQLADAMELQNSLTKRTNKTVRNLRDAATTALLAASKWAGQEGGLLDDPATIAKPKPPTIRLIGNGELDRAAQEGAKHAHRQTARRQADEFFASAANEANEATGTDDLTARPQSIDPLEFLVNDNDPVTEETNHEHDTA